MNEQQPKNAAKDLVTGVLLVVFSIYVIVSSLGMKYKDSFIDGAGFFPLIIGVVLCVLGAVLAFIGISTGGVSQLGEVLKGSYLKAFITNDRTYRVLILIAMMVVYIYVLLPGYIKIPGVPTFIWTSVVYLFATFRYLKACKKTGPIPGWVMELIISVATACIAYYAFKLGLHVTLP